MQISMLITSNSLPPPAVAFEHLYCTSAFWCDLCDQVLHCDMLQALFSDHIWLKREVMTLVTFVFIAPRQHHRTQT